MERFWRWNVLELRISGFKPGISGEEVCHSQKRIEDGIFLEMVFSGDERAIAKAGCLPLGVVSGEGSHGCGDRNGPLPVTLVLQEMGPRGPEGSFLPKPTPPVSGRAALPGTFPEPPPLRLVLEGGFLGSPPHPGGALPVSRLTAGTGSD